MSIGEAHEAMSLGRIQRFHREGLAELDKVTFGEDRAKTAVLLGQAMGFNVSLVGLPGGSKSDLLEASNMVVADVPEEHVVSIPQQADLRPEKVVGGLVEIDVATNDHTETRTTKLRPHIVPETVFLKIDEMSRINPHALGVALEVIRKGRVMTTAGPLVVKNLVNTVANLNPSESTQNTFNVADAMASRFPLGVVMGLRDRAVDERIADDGNPDTGSIKPRVTLSELAAMASLIKSSDEISMSKPLRGHLVDTVYKMTDYLADEFDFHETDHRMVMQARDIAKGISAFNADSEVKEEYAMEAARYILVSRLGLAGLRGSDLKVDEIDRSAQDLLGT